MNSAVARGIALMVGAVFFFSLMDVMAKILSTRVGVIQTLWARYAVQSAIVAVLVWPKGWQVMRTRYPKLQAFRSALMLFATAFFFIAFRELPLPEVIAIIQIAPIFITLGAAVFLGERFGWRRTIAIAAALIGALIIIQPGSPSFSSWLILPLIGTLCYSAYALATRFVGSTTISRSTPTSASGRVRTSIRSIPSCRTRSTRASGWTRTSGPRWSTPG